jgi:hypothetical protein
MSFNPKVMRTAPLLTHESHGVKGSIGTRFVSSSYTPLPPPVEPPSGGVGTPMGLLLLITHPA